MPRRIPRDPSDLLPEGTRWLREARRYDPEETFRNNRRHVNMAAGEDWNTRLSPEDERRFREWLRYHDIGGFDPDDPRPAYDCRGLWLALKNKEPGAVDAWNEDTGNGREFPPRFRTPFHPHFNSQSKFALPESDWPVGSEPRDVPSISITFGLGRRGG